MRNDLPTPKRAEMPFTFAEGPVWCEFRTRPADSGFLMIDTEGTRLWRSVTGKGDWTWSDPLNMPAVFRQEYHEAA